MNLAPDENVLDVGCGAGWLARLLAERVPEGRVIGMDISDEMVRRARRNYVALENAMFVIGGVDEIPWDANFFTHAISVESAYYWPDPARGVREIFRVLREGGTAWILINYYLENPHCHQWAGAVCDSRAIVERRANGQRCSATRASPRSRIARFPILRPRPNPIRADGSGTPRSFARSAKRARCSFMARRRSLERKKLGSVVQKRLETLPK